MRNFVHLWRSRRLFQVIINPSGYISVVPGRLLTGVSVGTVSPLSYCAGNDINIPFTITGTYNSGNTFTAQFSNNTGSFSSPVVIGSLTGTISGTISGAVPSNTPTGTGYLIRIISSNPADTSIINSAAITVNKAVPDSVHIQANPAGAICSGTNVTFTATPVNGGTNPVYQWKVNGSNTGINNASFSSNTLHNGDAITCVLTSNAPCVTGSPFTSNAITMNVNAAAGAGAITAQKDTLCTGDQVSLSDRGSSGNIQWQSSSNGNTFADINGATDTTYSATLQQTTYYRAYTTAGACNDTTSDLQVLVNALPAPPTIQTTDTIICSNDSSRLCVSGYASYLWNNGATTSCTYVNEAGGVWVTGTAANGCSNISSHVNISVYPVSSVSIVEQGDTLATFNGTAYQWLRNDTIILNATANTYVVTQTGQYSVQVADTNGCISTSASVLVTITSVGINEVSLENEVAIYPNPATGSFYIHYTSVSGKNLYLTMFNAVGEKVKEELLGVANNTDASVSISTLPVGVYLVQLQSGQNTMTKKIVVE